VNLAALVGGRRFTVRRRRRRSRRPGPRSVMVVGAGVGRTTGRIPCRMFLVMEVGAITVTVRGGGRHLSCAEAP